MICHYDVLIADAGSKREATYVIGVDLADGLDVDMQFVGAGGWERTIYVVKRRSGRHTWFDVFILFGLPGTDALVVMSKLELDGLIT